MEEIKQIKPKGLPIFYDFTKDECYKVLTGACSLDREFDQNDFTKIAGKRAHKTYCPRLYLAIKASQVMFDKPVEIQKYICKHFDVSDGRHRICICQRFDLPILANISTEKDNCPKCSDRSSAIINDEFTVIESE